MPLAAAPIRVLGPVEVVAVGEPAAVTGHVGLVLSLLVAAHPHTIDRASLTSAVWAEGPPATSASALRTYLSRIRALLDEHDLELTTSGSSVGLAGRLDRVDAIAFESAIDEVTPLLRQGAAADPHDLARRLEGALALWHGEPFAPYIEVEALRREHDRLLALKQRSEESLVEALLEAGDDDRALVVADALTRDEPFREHRWELLVVSLYRAGASATHSTPTSTRVASSPRSSASTWAPPWSISSARSCCTTRSSWRRSAAPTRCAGSARSSTSRPPPAPSADSSVGAT